MPQQASSRNGATVHERRAMRPLLPVAMLALAGALAALMFTSSAEGSRDADRGMLTVRNSQFGRILFDGRGFVLYGFTADGKRRSVCSGACAAAWPPYLVKGTPRAGEGAKGSLLGTIRRADGTRQVTYAGRPLYYYAQDRRPGQILCQGVNEFGGDWLVVRPTGAYGR